MIDTKSLETANLSEIDVHFLLRTVVVIGFDNAIRVERDGISDPAYVSVFKNRLFRASADLDEQLQTYRKFLISLMKGKTTKLSDWVVGMDLRKVPREIAFRVTMSSIRDYYVLTGEKRIEEFYDDLNISHSTGQKACRDGRVLQDFFARTAGGNFASVIVDGPADIGACGVKTIMNLTRLLPFKYISQVSELSEVKDPMIRAEMLDNPVKRFLVGSRVIEEKRLSECSAEKIRSMVRRLNQGESLDFVLGREPRQKNEGHQGDETSGGNSDQFDGFEKDDGREADTNKTSVEAENNTIGSEYQVHVAADFEHLCEVREKIISAFNAFKEYRNDHKSKKDQYAASQVMQAIIHFLHEALRYLNQVGFEEDFAL